MNFAIRVSYPENNEYDWDEALRQYADIGCIEAAFYSTELFLRNVKPEDVLAPFQKIPLTPPSPRRREGEARGPLGISSVHMAHVKITDFPLFELVLNKTIEIAKLLKCQDIVVHPSKGQLSEVRNFIENTVDKILNREKIFLCWETFTSKKRFLSGISGIAEFCHGKQWHKICYDFSHIHDEQEIVMKQISKYLEYIKVFHISNRISAQKIQHLPLFYSGGGKLDLDFMPIMKSLKDKDYNGALVLEYLPEFHSHLKEDALFLMNKF